MGGTPPAHASGYKWLKELAEEVLPAALTVPQACRPMPGPWINGGWRVRYSFKALG